MTTTVDISTENDADFRQVFFYKTLNSDGTPGDPIDISGAAFKMMLRVNAEDVTAEMELTTENGRIVVLDAPGGQFELIILQEDLERLDIDTYEHSLIMITPGNVQTRIWRGTLTNNAGPSR
jgi:hypothetical protein